MAIVETGEWMRDRAALACLHAYAEASDGELERLGVTREECLAMARSYIGEGYNDTALSTMFDRLATAYKLGKSSK